MHGLPAGANDECRVLAYYFLDFHLLHAEGGEEVLNGAAKTRLTRLLHSRI